MTERRIFADRYAQLSGVEPRKGGMSWLYPCTDLDLGTRVAVKVIEPRRDIDRIEETIFKREMNVQGLTHPNIARLHQAGRLDDTGQFFLVFDWVEHDLKSWVELRRPLGADDFVEQIALPLLRGLAYAHEHDVVHRDVKPTNVLVTDDDIPQLADFGISKVKHQLVEVGPTVVDFVSRPFAPPEGHHTSSYSRDVFSFGVLMLWCLAEIPVDDYGVFRDALDSIDASPKLLDLIEACTSLDENERPRTAVEVLARLEDIQAARREHWIPTAPLHLFLTQSASRRLALDLGISEPQVDQALKEDLSEAPAVRRLTDVDKRSPEEEHFFIYGSSVRLHVSLDPSKPTGTVIAAQLIDETECDNARDRNFVAEHFDLIFHDVVDTAGAITSVRRLISKVEEFEAAAREELAAREERRLFDQWRRQLDAREAFDGRPAGASRFSAATIDGFRLVVEAESPPEDDLAEQRRRVVDEENRYVGAGVIESVNGPRITLYLDREPRRPVRAGSLLPDNTASAIKLERERLALEAVRHKSPALVRDQLHDLLLHPSDVSAAELANMEGLDWVQDLDESKQEAVRAALGSDDFLVVEGPPGTGKTAFIAELVAQTLRSNAAARILIASQTNVALDNALSRVMELGEDFSLLRIGNPSSAKISEDVMALTVDEQLKRWRRRIEQQSERFLERLVTRAGVSVDTVRTSISLRKLAALQGTLDDLDAQKQDRVEQIARSATVGARASEVLTSDQIEEIQEEIRRISDLRKRTWAEVRELRENRGVAKVTREYGDLAVGDLRDLADSLLNPDDRSKIAPLLELHADWIARLGRGVEFHEALLQSTQVTAATCIGLTSFPGVDRARFDLCIVDEASKATATETLVPLVRAKRWILVGDDKQLPPFQDEALRSRELIDEFGLDEGELHRSLFTRMYQGVPSANCRRLAIQYRMVDPIGDLISSCFYNNQIENAGIAAPAWSRGLQPAAVTWFDTHQLPDPHEARRRGETSVSNPCEVSQVIRHLKKIDFLLSYQRLDVESISVLLLAPYAAQVQALHRAVAKASLTSPILHIEVNTVDAAQGREADILMFSATRSNDRSELGHVRDFARANVALSRGRFLLAIFGDAPFFDAVGGPLTDVLRHVRTHPATCGLEELVR